MLVGSPEMRAARWNPAEVNAPAVLELLVANELARQPGTHDNVPV